MPDPLDYGAMVSQANQAAAKRHPVIDFLNSPYNPFGIDPLSLVNQLARRTTGDFFFPKERLIRFRKERAQQEAATPTVRRDEFFNPQSLRMRP
jgi:hypothetical protein